MSCTICTAGFFSAASASTCSACSAGYHQPLAGQSSCPSPCNSGTYQPSGGQGGCVTSDIGYYVAADGAAHTAQVACSSGTYSAAGASSCVACSVSYYQPSSRQGSCLAQCAAGQCTSKDGTNCNSGTGSTSCATCPVVVIRLPVLPSAALVRRIRTRLQGCPRAIATVSKNRRSCLHALVLVRLDL